MKSNFANSFLGLSQIDQLKLPNARQFQSIDWRYFASIKIEQLENTLDFDVLQRILPYVTFCDVITEFENMDTNFQKFNQLCQIIIRYLLQSQNELLENFSLLNINFDQLADQLQRQLRKTAAQRKVIDNLRRQIYLSQSHVISFDPANSFPNMAKFACMQCNKIFHSLDFLRSHNERRHPPVQFDYNSAGNYQSGRYLHGPYKIPQSTKFCDSVKDTDEIHQLYTNNLSDSAIVELIEDKVNENVSFIEQNLKHRVTESQHQFIFDIQSTVQEEILRNSRELADFKEYLVRDRTKQDNMKSEFESLFKKCYNLVDVLKSQMDGR